MLNRLNHFNKCSEYQSGRVTLLTKTIHMGHLLRCHSHRWLDAIYRGYTGTAVLPRGANMKFDWLTK